MRQEAEKGSGDYFVDIADETAFVLVTFLTIQPCNLRLFSGDGGSGVNFRLRRLD